jgi:hypothetical protein
MSSTGRARSARRIVPYLLLPLSLIACTLASAPWLRAFPASVLAAPLFGAAALSVLVPVVVVGVGVRRLWVSAAIDVAIFVFYELVVTLQAPSAVDRLYDGIVHGPAAILSYALPLMSPRTLLVAPVALCWLTGSIVGECLARGWQSVLPYLSLLVTFGLAYAASGRAVTDAADGRRYDTLLAAALLIALLLLRTAQAWVAQDESAEPIQPDGLLPLRGLAIGAALAIAVAALAAGAVQAPAFTGRPVAPARVPPLDESRPLTPVAFVAGLRPSESGDPGRLLFTVNTERAASNYLALASVDYYDGDSWSFSRTFRPSGGAVPADPDPAMRPPGAEVTQRYEIADGPLTAAPWMPHLDRPTEVSGVAVDIDPDSGMIVPAEPIRSGATYTVTSAVPSRTFSGLHRSALLGTSASPLDTSLPNGLSGPLNSLVNALAQETGVPSDAPIPFLQAVARQLRVRTTLAGVTPGPAPAPPSSPPTSAHTGGTAFADVLASIRGSRSGTPEQFATFVALVARRLNVPARVVSGFRLPPVGTSGELPSGTYQVTSREAWTWVEIPIRGLGWVVLDAAPSQYADRAPEPTEGVTRPPAPTPTPSQNALLNHSNNGGHAVAPPSRVENSPGISAAAIAVFVVVATAVVVLLALALLVLRKQLRQRRRRHGDPRHRVVGAWQESVDLLVEAGLPDLSAATTQEVAAATGERFGSGPGEQARAVGTAADVAIFSPRTAMDAAQADAAWHAHAELRRAVRQSLPWHIRIAARLRYHRPRH